MLLRTRWRSFIQFGLDGATYVRRRRGRGYHAADPGRGSGLLRPRRGQRHGSCCCHRRRPRQRPDIRWRPCRNFPRRQHVRPKPKPRSAPPGITKSRSAPPGALRPAEDVTFKGGSASNDRASCPSWTEHCQFLGLMAGRDHQVNRGQDEQCEHRADRQAAGDHQPHVET